MGDPRVLDLLRIRDVAVVDFGEIALLTSVDIASGIGPRHDDLIQAEGSVVGQSVARTAAAELISLGATISTVSISASGPDLLEATVAGVQEFLRDSGIAATIVSSSENYVRTSWSAISVTVNALTLISDLVIRPVRPGDYCYTLGDGYEGPGRTLRPPAMESVREILTTPSIRQVIPVGSRGLDWDLSCLAKKYSVRISTKVRAAPRGGPGLQYVIVTEDPIDVAGIRPVGQFF